MAGVMKAAVLRGARALVVVFAVTVSGAVTGYLVGDVGHRVSGNRMAPWIVGRASGVAAYLLLVLLILSGLVLAHPGRVRLRWPGAATRIRIHITVATFALALLLLHIVVLATDRYAGVGAWGSVVPMGASYRPVPVTLGVIGAWAGLLAGVTAASAHRLPMRAWWPLHKVVIVAFVLVWLHGVTAGSDAHALTPMYLSTGAAILVVALWRYSARTPADATVTAAHQVKVLR